MIPYPEFRIGLCCRRLRHLAVALARWALVREPMLFGPYLASISANIAILFMSPLSTHWVANDRGWLTSTVSLFGLFGKAKSSFPLGCWVPLLLWTLSSGHIHVMKRSSHLVLTLIAQSRCLFPRPPCPQSFSLAILLPPGPWPNKLSHLPLPRR